MKTLDFRGINHHRLGRILVPRPISMAQFPPHSHFKILIEAPHPNPNVGSLKFGRIKIFIFVESGKGTGPPTHPVASPLMDSHKKGSAYSEDNFVWHRHHQVYWEKIMAGNDNKSIKSQSLEIFKQKIH